MPPELDLREVCRYMGVKGEPEPALREMLEGAARAVEAAAEPRKIVRRFPLEWIGEDILEIEGMQIRSRALAGNLRGCRQVYLMAATIGIEPDRLVARAQARGEMARAMALQAAAAAMIEAVCDRVNDALRAEAAAEGLFLRPRFSPGYGDLALECQTGLFRLLEVQKRIGVTLSDRLLMTPSKSVTAVIGISGTCAEAQAGCAACGKRDCAFRREP